MGGVRVWAKISVYPSGGLRHRERGLLTREPHPSPISLWNLDPNSAPPLLLYGHPPCFIKWIYFPSSWLGSHSPPNFLLSTLEFSLFLFREPTPIRGVCTSSNNILLLFYCNMYVDLCVKEANCGTISALDGAELPEIRVICCLAYTQ